MAEVASEAQRSETEGAAVHVSNSCDVIVFGGDAPGERRARS
jgi:hypothetical protein